MKTPLIQATVPAGRRGERGFLLVAVLVIVVLASMLALSLLFRMRAEQASFGAALGSEQAWSAAMSGIQQAMHLAAAGTNDPTVWQNNPDALRHQLILDDGADRWYFTVYCPGVPGETEPRYGLVDENGKLNLNKATAEMLGKATYLSASQIQGITGGSASTNAPAPIASAATLGQDSLAEDPLAAISGPVRPHFSTLDELLKTPTFTPGVIYGEDANHNYHLDPNEDDGMLIFPPDDSDGQLFLGLRDVATVYSYEYDVAADGSPKFQLNSTNRSVPEFIIPPVTATFIEAAWSNNIIFKSPADLLGMSLKVKDSEGKEMELVSGVGAKELPVILDQLTTTFEARLVGLININTASVKVLQTIPGVDEAKAQLIIERRESLVPELKQSPGWLFSEGVLGTNEFKLAASFITTRAQQFSFSVVGYALPSGRYRVYEVVIDLADKQPQILYLRDITRFGLPFALPAGDENPDVQPQS